MSGDEEHVAIVIKIGASGVGVFLFVGGGFILPSLQTMVTGRPMFR